MFFPSLLFPSSFPFQEQISITIPPLYEWCFFSPSFSPLPGDVGAEEDVRTRGVFFFFDKNSEFLVFPAGYASTFSFSTPLPPSWKTLAPLDQERKVTFPSFFFLFGVVGLLFPSRPPDLFCPAVRRNKRGHFPPFFFFFAAS